MSIAEQTFLEELDKKLWLVASLLRNNMGAANGNHVALAILQQFF